ncbi:hypothetical protein COT75_01310 [Candidatus Beckwithbacteria bacterium CG10_big_fil_rev_8_21_14_0_10_34_10]|uniref:PIG-L family deacetylase n=1 Tax=Candidatus Beckwithbacteria bacterium CG10_big_fil_rev_8_21_14_0_10_34_10 TaxID=1974495 RepID=A0A2H0WC61_9BACT|nr:MAG: hypothetical protein COT75_01310 [Candidatus Beckwithbacteria bacterium CG10_big_fil_rev_8_21_14_0_10_34_10]
MIKRIEVQDFINKTKNKQNLILGIFAHPDDEVLNMGGLIIKAVQKNIKVVLICLSRGEKGITSDLYKNNIDVIRKKEFFQAGKIYGLEQKDLKIYNFPDGRFFYSQDKLEKKLLNLLFKYQPSVIVTHDPSGKTYHPDHITTSIVLKKIISRNFLGKTRFYYSVYSSLQRKTYKNLNKNIYQSNFPPDFKTMPKPDYCLKLNNKDIEIQKKACLAYKSQRLFQNLSLDLDLWLNLLFDKEYYHLVKLQEKYLFKFRKYKYKEVNFKNESQKKT